ncbi:26S proteasome non-ATPase regulatory subunit 11-like [Halichondria panicea]|uniref:26S proteasome non-ATPase regulatory subunit 11-like n=1 Tax=Halichondria panicea TaxID=6063 RepID=UPI00312BA6B7
MALAETPGELLHQAGRFIDNKSINEGIDLLNVLVSMPVVEGELREEYVKIKELAILKLGATLAKHGFVEDLGELIQQTRAMINLFSKAKAAKLIRELVDLYLDADKATGHEVELCEACIKWAQDENRVFLRQALQSRLVAVYVDSVQYTAALTIAAPLLKELKKIDDKALLVEVQLLESRAYQKLGNITRSRASLTSAKTTANGIYCPPKLQASLDLQSGVLHGEEKDFKTGYSYFYEAFESLESIDSPQAVLALKYMLLCKIMLNTPEDVHSIITGKLALKYAGPQIEAMQSIARASEHRSVAEFKKTIKELREFITGDPIVKAHLDSLYDTLLEQNLLRIIEPYSCVEIDHVAKIIELPLDQVEKKLSQMILDKSLNGILDQGRGVLIVFEDTAVDQTYTTSLDTISSMGKVVDGLYSRALQLQ